MLAAELHDLDVGAVGVAGVGHPGVCVGAGVAVLTPPSARCRFSVLAAYDVCDFEITNCDLKMASVAWRALSPSRQAHGARPESTSEVVEAIRGLVKATGDVLACMSRLVEATW